MKKIIMIVGALLLSSGCLTAQDTPPQDTAARGYRSFFGNESSEWLMATSVPDAPSMMPYGLKAIGDTIINGQEYKPLVDFEYGLDENGLIYGEMEHAGWMREDTATGQLWVRNINGEFLVADMSLNVGDTFYFSQMNREIVDTVFVDSLGRKVVKFDSRQFIEGVGPNVFYLWNHWYWLICTAHDAETVFKNWELNADYFNVERCYIVRQAGIQLAKEDMPQIYPNPCHGSFNVMLKKTAHVVLYDTHGRKVFDKNITNGLSRIELGNIGKGLYMTQIMTADQLYTCRILNK